MKPDGKDALQKNVPVLARLRKQGQPVKELLVVDADISGLHRHAPVRYLVVAVSEKTEVVHE